MMKTSGPGEKFPQIFPKYDENFNLSENNSSVSHPPCMKRIFTWEGNPVDFPLTTVFQDDNY